MEEVLCFAQTLHGSPTLLWWVIFVVVCIVLLANKKKIGELFDSSIEERRERKRTNIVLVELIRNNTAALENNTAALNAVKNDRAVTHEMLEHHDRMSEERIAHVQEIVNRIDRTVTSNSKAIGLIEDRTSN